MKAHTISLVGAHGGYAGKNFPLGGGATIFESLIEAWSTNPDLKLEILAPGPAYPTLQNWAATQTGLPGFDFRKNHPASLGYFQYARFCRLFESIATKMLLSRNPRPGHWVLVNDLCESPNISALRAAGYGVITLVHVDVVDFTSRLYLRGAVSPRGLVAGWNAVSTLRLSALLPDIARLIFEKQEAAYKYSHFIIVPSATMKTTIHKCYPKVDEARIAVIPWGNPNLQKPQKPTPKDIRAWKESSGIDEKDFVLLTLSRISPEKGIDRALEALLKLEETSPELAAKTHLVIAGDAAYMDGPRTLRKLKALAGKLRHARVKFTGHLAGSAKSCAFAASNLYLFLSRHESYGLTLSEAQSYGLPALVSREVEKRLGADGAAQGVDTSPAALALELARCIRANKSSTEPLTAPKLFHHAATQILELTDFVEE